jgi:hypothetical protein
MLNKIILVIVAAAFLQASALSQKYVVRAEIGRGAYNMNDLKSLLNSNDPYLGVDLKTVSFPAYWSYGFSVLSYLDSGFGLGVTSELYSSGGNNYYADYSGTYKFELLTQSMNFGVISSYKIKIADHHSILLEISQGIKFSNLSESESLFIHSEIFSYCNRYFSNSYWLKPVIRYEYSLTRSISAGAYFGGEFNPRSDLHLKYVGDVLLTDPQQNEVSINWTGIRFGLHFSVNIQQ